MLSSKEEITDALTFSDGRNWNGTPKGAPGQPLSISFSFVSSLPWYYNIPDPNNGSENEFLGWVDESNPNNIASFTNAQQIATYQATLAWESVANINFENLSDNNPNAVITLGNAKFTAGTGPNYYAITTGMANNKVGGENNAEGDIWLNMSGPKGAANLNDTDIGEDGFEAILHELGYALGLEHPFRTSAGYVDQQLIHGDHTQLYTTMSYTKANIQWDGQHDKLRQ